MGKDTKVKSKGAMRIADLLSAHQVLQNEPPHDMHAPLSPNLLHLHLLN